MELENDHFGDKVMTQIAKRLKDELAQLSAQDRSELAHYLIGSLEAEVDDDADAAWADELDRRAAEIRSGNVAGIPAEQVMGELKRKFS